MWWLHALAVLSALTFGGTFFSGAGALVPGWQVALAFLGGALVPYAVAAVWALLVAPPNLRSLLDPRLKRKACENDAKAHDL
jgi:hypothetical protein